MGIANEKKVTIDSLSESKKGDPVMTTGLNGVGKLISPNVTRGDPSIDVGLTESDGRDTIPTL